MSRGHLSCIFSFLPSGPNTVNYGEIGADIRISLIAASGHFYGSGK